MVLILGYLILAGVLLVVIFGATRLIRLDHPSCPSCFQHVQGLTEPRCPECGSSFDKGVLPAGGTRPTAAVLLALIALVIGFVFALPGAGMIQREWPSVLRAKGLIYADRWSERKRTISIDEEDRLAVLVHAEYRLGSAAPTGDIRVTVTRDEDVLASWAESGPVETKPQEGMILDAAPAVASLQKQIPAESDSPFAPLLHDPADAAILKSAIERLAAPSGSVSLSWEDGRGNAIFDKGVRTSMNMGYTSHYPAWGWYAPVYVIPFLILAAFGWLAWLIVARSRSRIPFNRYDIEGTESSLSSPQQPESAPCASPSHSSPSSQESSS